MTQTMSYLTERSRIIFWRSAALATAFALKHRQGLYQALTYAPIAIVALAAFVLGRGIGLLIGNGLF